MESHVCYKDQIIEEVCLIYIGLTNDRNKIAIDGFDFFPAKEGSWTDDTTKYEFTREADWEGCFT